VKLEDICELATEIANEHDSDIYFYAGAIGRPFDDKVIDEVRGVKRRTNVILILCTFGGDPSAGYRIARCLQQKYEKFSILIAGTCKSAGTLVTVGAHEIVMSDLGEMGPLDVQVDKKDELWEADSGLTVLSAIKALEEKSFDLFEACFLNLKRRSGGQITLKTATEVASKLAIGTVAPIIAQIDPMYVGEASRAMNIGLDYGSRLSEISKNAYDDTLQKLANSYPSHAFVIDREEAKELFLKVREPSEKESLLLDSLGSDARYPSQEPMFGYLSSSLEEVAHEGNEGENSERRETSNGNSTPASEDPESGTEGGMRAGELKQILGRRGIKA